jgi:hypothetical protein
MKWVVLVLLMVGFVSAVDIEFDCPDEIFAEAEFECLLEVYDGDGVYDVKIDLDGERNSVVELWNYGEWKSGYFYLKEFVEDGDEVDVKMRVSEEGDYEGVLKLRQGDKREFFDIEIEVLESEVIEEEEDIIEEGVVLNDKPEVVALNEAVIYESRDRKVVGWLPYGFCLFLILVIGVLVWERF